jgi:DNA repair exonuclease SbcCD ATPase subunit
MKSLPGQFLYPLKIVFEKARIALALKEGDKVELEVEYATRRLDELEQIIQKEEPEEVIKTVANFQEKLNTVKSALETIDETYPVSKAIKIAKKVDQKTREFEDVLDKTEKNLPEKELKKKIKEVKEVVDKTNTQALKVMVECQIEEEEILPRIEDKIEKIEETLERPEVKKALEEAKEALAKKNFSIALEIIEKIQETEEEVVETEEEVVETEIKETTQPAQESQVEEVQSFKEDYKKDGDEKDRAEKEKKDDEAEEVKIKADFKGDLILEPEEGVFGGLLKIEN